MRNKHIHILRISVILSILYCYAAVLWELMKKWEKEDLYSYGFFIPVISIYLVWLKRRNLRESERKPDIPLGIGILVMGLSILLLGRIGSMIVIQELSIIITITGFIILLFGKKIYKLVWFPVVYLIFMVPIWDSLLEPLQYPFQSLSASIGAKLISIIGVPVIQDGINIELPNITLVVASVCSGVNYLISVVAIGIPMNYLYLSSWRRRIVIIFLAVLIAILANGLRVAAIGLFSYYEGVNAGGTIHGPFDIFRSMLITIIGFAFLFGMIFLLKDKDIAMTTPSGPDHLKKRGNIDSFVNERSPGWMRHSYLIALTLTIATGTFVNFHNPRYVTLKNRLVNIPYTIGDWKGVNIEPFSHPALFKESGADEEVSRSYRDNFDNEIKLYVAYWGSQVQGKELINFKLDHLFKDSYKYKLNKNTVYIHNEKQYGNDAELKNNVLIYWININGRIIGNKYLAKTYTMWDFITHGRTNNALIMVKIHKKNGENVDQAIYRNGNFIEDLQSVLKHYLPEI